MEDYDYSELFRAAKESDNIFDSDSEQDSHVDSDYCESLIAVSDLQYDVITHPFNLNEILSVRAGPGSGKTFTISARIAHMLANGTDPSEILVLSMANRSVDALHKSLAAIIGEEMASQVDISTFHSFCGLIVDQYAHVFEPLYSKRRIFDKQCWRKLARLFLNKNMSLENNKLEGTITPVRLDKLLAEVTSGVLTVEQAAERYKVNANYIDTLVTYLERYGMMRYSDLITGALSLMKLSLKMDDMGNPMLMPRVSAYKAVFVDEFQDMYPLLMSVVRAIVKYPTDGHIETSKHLTICGDQNQSIYDFLGASLRSMSHIQNEFPRIKLTELPLSESFRCVQPILDAAFQICLKPEDQIVERLISNRETDFAIRPILVQHKSQDSEIRFIADEIVRLICCLGGLIYPEDIAVLTRTNLEAESVQAVLQEEYGIKSNKISQGNIWVLSPMHIYRDILSVISGESDSSFSLLNLLSILDPNRGAELRASKVFNASVKEVDMKASNFLESYLFDEMVKVENKEPNAFLNTVYKNFPKLLENLAKFLNQVQYERDNLNRLHSQDPLYYDPLQLSRCLTHMAKLPGIKEFLSNNEKQDLPFTSYLQSFNNSLHHSYENFVLKADTNAMTFIDHFLQSYDNEVPVNNKKMVQVSTIHSAKGLEFPIVFVLGRGKHKSYWDTYLLPHDNDEWSSSNLLYVALTRARDILYLGSSAKHESLLLVAQQYFQTETPNLGDSTDYEIDEITREFSARAQISPACEQEDKATRIHHANSKLRNVALAENSAHVLNVLSKDLHRPIPLPEKLTRGMSYYRDIVKGAPAHVTLDQHVSHSGFQRKLSPLGPRNLLGVINRGKNLIRRL